MNYFTGGILSVQLIFFTTTSKSVATDTSFDSRYQPSHLIDILLPFYQPNLTVARHSDLVVCFDR